MVGKRKNPSDLPPRTYKRNGGYYFVSKATGKWIWLGKNLEVAKRMGQEFYEGRRRDPTAVSLSDIAGAAECKNLKDVGASGRLITGLFERAKRGALTRRIKFHLTLQDVAAAYIESGGKCSATGIEFSSKREPGDRIALWAPSIDRIDSRGDYDRLNIRAVCVAFNLAAQDHGDEVFSKLAEGFLKMRNMVENARHLGQSNFTLSNSTAKRPAEAGLSA